MADKKVFNAITPPFDAVRNDLADLATKNHSDLDQLAWSVAGHTIDTNFDFAGFNLLNCGIININATADHTIANSSDDLVITNPNSDGDFKININDGGTPYDVLTFDASDGQVILAPSASAAYGVGGLFKVSGNMAGAGVFGGMAFSPTLTAGATFAAILAQPTGNFNTAIIAFYLNPSFGATYNQKVEGFRMVNPTHKAGYNDEFKMLTHSTESRTIFTFSADSSTIDYKWVAFGGAFSVGDFGAAAPAVTEEMIRLTGGVSRVAGTNGSYNQTGLIFSGFGTQVGLIAGVDSCYAMKANGGIFWHDYTYNGTTNLLGFGTTSTTPDMGIGYNGTAGVIDTSLQNASDLNVACGTDKTVVLNETVWLDINLGAGQLSKPASSQPTVVSLIDNTGTDTNIETLGFDVGEKIHGSMEFNHFYAEGTDYTFHLHWQGNSAPTGTDKVQWQLTYTIMRYGQTLMPVTTITVETDIDTQYEGMLSAFASISGTGRVIGDQFHFTLERIAASSAEYGDDAVIGTVGLHVQADTVGSRQIGTK